MLRRTPDLSRLPKNRNWDFDALCAVYHGLLLDHASDDLEIHAMAVAQWAVESGWGKSVLGDEYLNYAGMKWRSVMERWAEPVEYAANDGLNTYCRFFSQVHFIKGYWARFDLIPSYGTWRQRLNSPRDFIAHVGPVWVGTHPLHQAGYVEKVIRVYEDHTKHMYTA